MLRSLVEKKGKFDFRRRMHPSRIEDQAAFDKMVDLGVIDCLDPATPFISKATPWPNSTNIIVWKVSRLRCHRR